MAKHSPHDLTVLERLERMDDKGGIRIRTVLLMFFSLIGAIAVVLLLVYGALVFIGFYSALASP